MLQIIEYNIKKINILGINIVVMNMFSLLTFVSTNIKILSSKYICVSNVHAIIMAYDDSKYREIQNSAVLAIPDGGLLSSYGRSKGYKEISRITRLYPMYL